MHPAHRKPRAGPVVPLFPLLIAFFVLVVIGAGIAYAFLRPTPTIQPITPQAWNGGPLSIYPPFYCNLIRTSGGLTHLIATAPDTAVPARQELALLAFYAPDRATHDELVTIYYAAMQHRSVLAPVIATVQSGCKS